jgi:hypothetical protein
MYICIYIICAGGRDELKHVAAATTATAATRATAATSAAASDSERAVKQRRGSEEEEPYTRWRGRAGEEGSDRLRRSVEQSEDAEEQASLTRTPTQTHTKTLSYTPTLSGGQVSQRRGGTEGEVREFLCVCVCVCAYIDYMSI